MKSDSNVGKWNRWNDGPPGSYGEVTTYEMAAEIFKECQHVADWGCGRCFFRQYVGTDRYIGVDGSPSPLTDIVTDLAEFSDAPLVGGVMLRHVLEHDWKWKKILSNAAASFGKVLVIILFTPWSDGETKDIAFDHPEIDCPDLAFSRAEFMAELKDFDVSEGPELKTKTVFGIERVITVRHR
jgi:hypothetical protein